MHKNLNLYGLCKIEAEEIVALKVKLYYTNSIKSVLLEVGDYVNIAYLEKDNMKTLYGKIDKIINSNPKTLIIDYSDQYQGNKAAIKIENIRDIENISDESKTEYIHVNDSEPEIPNHCRPHGHPHPNDLGYCHPIKKHDKHKCDCDYHNKPDDDLAD